MNAPQRRSPAAQEAPAAERIGHLDGLRGIAILAVIGYHYYARFAGDAERFYPYGRAWSGFLPFAYGYYGVYLFFAISGFVIALSLERCRTIGEFAVRRFARLWPTMLLCSLLTYAVLSIWPRFWPQSPVNFLPSLTFIDGQVWNRFIPHLDAQWIDGSYWSLFVEVRFYALAAAIYFIAPKRFAAALAAFSTLVVAARVGLHAIGRDHAAGLLDLMLVPEYLPWFLIGVAALADLRGRRRGAAGLLALAGALLVLLVLGGDRPLHLTAFAGVVVLVFAPGRFQPIARVLSARWLAGIGVASYSLYLLHQDIGITMTAVIADALAMRGPAALATSMLVTAALLFVALGIFRYWETPMNRAIVERFSKGRSTSGRTVRAVAAASVP